MTLGFALSFAPHLNNKRTKVYWHRTEKSAKLDLLPFYTKGKNLFMNRFCEPEDHPKQVKRSLDLALSMSAEYFGRVKKTQDLLPLFEELEKYQKALGYWSYANIPIAHAFTLRATGNETEGRKLLEATFEQRVIPEATRPELWRSFNETEI